MSGELDTLATAKRPTHKRARERFERVLDAAEELLVEDGLSGFSIPVLAERRSCPAYPLPPEALLKAPAQVDFLTPKR